MLNKERQLDCRDEAYTLGNGEIKELVNSIRWKSHYDVFNQVKELAREYSGSSIFEFYFSELDHFRVLRATTS